MRRVLHLMQPATLGGDAPAVASSSLWNTSRSLCRSLTQRVARNAAARRLTGRTGFVWRRERECPCRLAADLCARELDALAASPIRGSRQ